MLDPCGFGIYLSEQIQVHGIVDGHEVIQGRDGADVVGVAYGSRHTFRIPVQIVVQLFCTCAEAVDLAAFIDIFLCAGDLSGHGDIDEGIHIHFCMDAQIL